MDSVVDTTSQLLEVALERGLPVFFTTHDYDPADPRSPYGRRVGDRNLNALDDPELELDPRLDHLPSEKVLRNRYAYALKATNSRENLTALGVDTSSSRV